jgi:DNA-binding winged helix-turn-helix (wHTH) protein/TolB-like protein
VTPAPVSALDSAPLDDFSVGSCRVHPAENTMRCDGELIPLEPKVMMLLVYLAQNAGSTISREQLFEAIWPGVVVSDDTLTQAVTKLRKAFGDNAKHPRYIQTVPKRGYRLCAAVTRARDALPTTRASGRDKLRRFIVAALVLLAGAITIFISVDRQESAPPQSMPDGQITPDGRPTLTVVPFRLLGGDNSQAYLAQGLTYDLITDLSKLSGLLVIGSRSIMGQQTAPQDMHPVRYRVQGEVQRIDEELRVHVHLSDAQSGQQLWSERYLRPIDNLFEIQAAISRQIVTTLAIKVDQEEQRRLARRYTHSVRAYELFLRAQSLLLVRLRPENEDARGLFRQAIAIDPAFARAYGGLALSFAADFRNQWTSDGAAALQRAHAVARTALEIDPEIPEVYWVLAYVSAQQRQHENAVELLRKAVSLDHSFADAYALMGGIKTYMGRPDETLPLVRTAMRLNPDAGYLYFLLLGRAYYFLDDWEQSLINLDEALERNPSNLEAHIYLAATLAAAGSMEEAAWQREEILTLRPDFDAETWLQTYPMSDQDRLLTMLRELGL